MNLQEFQRFEWSSLRAMGDAARVPHALTRLTSAQTTEEAEQAYWNIDNTVVVQGAVYESALPTVICALESLLHCTDAARPLLLELVTIICSGEPAIEEIQHGNAGIVQACVREACRGVAIFFFLLARGTPEERMWCVDMLDLCCGADETLKPRIVWWFQALLTHDLPLTDKAMIARCLAAIIA